MNTQLLPLIITNFTALIFLFYIGSKYKKLKIEFDRVEKLCSDFSSQCDKLNYENEALLKKMEEFIKDANKTKPKTAEQDLDLLSDLMSEQARTLIEIRRISPANVFMRSPKDN